MKLLEVALNGCRGRVEHPGIPLTPEELSSQSADSVRAGAGAIHFHVRSRNDGRESLDAGDLEEGLRQIRAAVPKVPVGVSTAAWIVPQPTARLEAIEAWEVLPDFASVNFHEADATGVARLLLSRGVSIEAGISDAATAHIFIRTGLVRGCLRVLIEPIDRNLAIARREAKQILGILNRSGVPMPPLLLHGFDTTTWGLLDDAARLGYQMRIGLEDTLRLPKGEIATDNAQLVTEAQTRAAKVDRRGR